MGAGQDAYEAYARAYARDNESNVWNSLYERPASLALLGDVAGLHVLDAGCGAGAHAAALLERGAMVTGIDRSTAMVEIARERLGGRAELAVADLAEPLPFAEGRFDAALASLVLHYLRDWEPALAELRRVLAPAGRLVISTHHPFMDHLSASGSDYFATYRISEEWSKDGEAIAVSFWHRPLRAMVASLQASGFSIERIEEPQPDPAVRELDPEAWLRLTSEPRFIFFAARALG